MNQQKMIVVTGATGAQGSSVIKALLANSQYTVRALTQNARSSKAQALRDTGVEVIEGNFDDVETLTALLQGAYGVFGVTSGGEPSDKEYQQGKNLVDAVQAAGVQHFVYSSQPGYSQLSNGQWPVPRCDVKAAIKRYTKELKLPASFVEVSFYYENFLSAFPLQRDAGGGFYFGFPQGDTKLAMTSVEDMGGVVAAVFNYPQEYIGRTVGVVAEDLTCAEYAQILEKVLGRNICFRHIPRQQYAAMDIPGAEEWANMFEVQRLYVPQRQLDLIESHGLNPSMQRFEAWLGKNREAFLKGFDVQLGAAIS